MTGAARRQPGWNLLVLRGGLTSHERSEDHPWPDMDLLKRTRAHTEFERFAAMEADGLIRTAYLMVGDRGDAEDIVQECMLRLAGKWPRVRKMEHPGSYARRVMVSLVLDGRHQRTRRTLELAATAPEHAAGVSDQPAAWLDARADLIWALRGLSPRHRTVLVLRYFSDLPEAEVAAILRCSVGTVKSSASRALTQLRLALEDSSPETADASEQHAPRRTLP
jgi:RNA polymerase sigma-70 factor (sigma-E family)